jgi:hypothetical protein
MIPYELLKEFIFHGVRFSYESYDHKKALEEIRELEKQGIFQNQMFGYRTSTFDPSYGVPDEIKQNHIVWRTGKLRLVYFDKNGKMCRFKIGQRWAKNFYLNDFGVRVKPMIFKSDDYLDLIGQGLAVEESL